MPYTIQSLRTVVAMLFAIFVSSSPNQQPFMTPLLDDVKFCPTLNWLVLYSYLAHHLDYGHGAPGYLLPRSAKYTRALCFSSSKHALTPTLSRLRS
jgi:hypothetical protein